MNTTTTLRSLVLSAAFIFAAAFGAQAAPDDYAFKIISSELHPGEGVNISVSLTDLRTNAPVADAVIFTTRLDMAPEGMEGMTAPVEVVPSGIPGKLAPKSMAKLTGKAVGSAREVNTTRPTSLDSNTC